MASSSRNSNIHWVQSLASNTNSNHTSTGQQISVFSWNVLAQRFFDQKRMRYTHVVAAVDDASPILYSWPERFVRILNELSLSEADILCLQEVESDAFDRDFLPSLQKLGYEGLMQTSKRRGSSTHGVGVATFWKSGRFQIQDASHRSRTMIATFRDNLSTNNKADNENSNILAIVNCHLEGSPYESIKRVKQLQNALNELSSKFSHHNLVVCGDMNSNLASSVCATYLKLGCIPEQAEIFEWGRYVSFADTAVPPPHRYSLHSAYPIELARDEPTEYITYVSTPGNYAVALDQIWVHNDDDTSGTTLNVVGLRHPFHSRDQQQQILATGLPSELHPSDHLPIGCILEWTGTATTTQAAKELCKKRKSTSDALFVREEEKMSAEEMILEAMQLFNACPFDSEEDRAELDCIITPVSGLPKKGKPSGDQLEELKGRRIKKQALLAKVSDEARQMIERGLKLLKESDKLNKL